MDWCLTAPSIVASPTLVIWFDVFTARTMPLYCFFFSSRRRHTRFDCDWRSDVCSSDLLRLGQAHFDQFTSADRDQKNTEIAKGYFENVITNYPKSPQAAEAKQKLAKALEYLAEHEFNVAFFYYQQEKFSAARDRFEEIVRKYKDTPTAVKRLFYLGESYRNEKNSLRATLAYEAVIQHYPQSKFAADARTQLAQVEKE